MNNLGRDFWIDRSVLVTGATGFIGAWVCAALNDRGARVTVIVRDSHNPFHSIFPLNSSLSAENLVHGDVQNYELVRRVVQEYEIDTCFHLAAQAIVNQAFSYPVPTFETNIMGTWSVLEACRLSKTVEGVIVASSDKAYGEPKINPITEEHPLEPSFPYDASKACADILARSYSSTYGMAVAIARCANTYGGGDLNFSRIIPSTIKSVLSDQQPIIRSDGKPQRDYIYIEDIVNAYLTLAENVNRAELKGKGINFGTGKPVSVLDLVRLIVNVCGKDLEPKLLNQDKQQIMVQYLSPNKAKILLGWEARVSLIDGLKRTVVWYRENQSVLKR